MRSAVSGAFAVDRSGFAPVVAVRAAAGVTIPFAIGAAAGHLADGSIAAAGALPAGVAAMTGGFRNNSGVVAGTAIGMAVSTFVGSLVAGHDPALIVALIGWGFAAGICVVLGREATLIGTQAVIGLVVFGRFPGSVAISAVHGAWVLAGGGFQGLIALLIRPPQRFAAERRTLASTYAELADVATNPARPAFTAASEAAMSASLLRHRTPGEDVELLRGLSDEADRIRLELQALATAIDVPNVRELRMAASVWLTGIAVALRAGEASPPESETLARRVDALRGLRDAAPLGRRGTSTRYAAARASALLGQLRAVDRLVTALAGVRRLVLPRVQGVPAAVMLPQRAADSWRRVAMSVRDPRSSAYRHAIRLAIILPVAEAISHVLPWQRGYWVTLTAVVVLKPDYAATTKRGIERVGGTALGVVSAGLLLAAIHPSGSVLAILLAIATWFAYTSFNASYTLYTIGITATVVLLLTPLGGNELSTVADRGLDTVIGGALALIAYAVWPTWERSTLDASTSRLLAALAHYADVLLTGYADPEQLEPETTAAAAMAARRARITAQASLNRAIAEPARAAADTETAAGTLAAARRIVIALHALRVTLDDATDLAAVPEVVPIRDEIVSALDGLARRRPIAVDGLRDRQVDLAAEDSRLDELDTLAARRRALLASHLDPLVDSVDTLAHVMRAVPATGSAEGTTD